jgi:hypothetical protein
MRCICAHNIAVAFQEGKLEQLLANYQPPNNRKTAESQQNQSKAGRKPGYCPRKRVNQPRSVAGFEEPYLVSDDEDDDEPFGIVFVKDTTAYKCFGCTGMIRKDGKSLLPPPPFDIFVKTKTFRHYRESAKNGNPGKLHIKTKKENVYYHPQLACIARSRAEVAENLTIPEEIQHRLTKSHKDLIWNEFGFRL